MCRMEPLHMAYFPPPDWAKYSKGVTRAKVAPERPAQHGFRTQK
jgi:hypothetical protein